jgi:hypothetical protein
MQRSEGSGVFWFMQLVMKRINHGRF